MSQSRKVIKDYSAIYLDGLRLDTTALGALTLGGNEVGGGGGVTGSSFANLYVANTITSGSMVVGIEGTAIELGSTGIITCNKIVGSTGSSFGNFYVDGDITAGSLTIGTVEGIAASISDGGVVTCINIAPLTFSPPIIRSTQGTSISTGVNTYYNQFGSILTVSSTLPTQGSAAFVVSNGYVTADTRVISNIVNYTGTQGLPSVYVSNAANGQFTVTLQNNSIVDPLDGAVEIGFIALK
jgi:hypothetical protein